MTRTTTGINHSIKAPNNNIDYNSRENSTISDCYNRETLKPIPYYHLYQNQDKSVEMEDNRMEKGATQLFYQYNTHPHDDYHYHHQYLPPSTYESDHVVGEPITWMDTNEQSQLPPPPPPPQQQLQQELEQHQSIYPMKYNYHYNYSHDRHRITPSPKLTPLAKSAPIMKTTATTSKVLPHKRRVNRDFGSGSSSMVGVSTGGINSSSSSTGSGAKHVRFATTKRVAKIYSSREDLDQSWYADVEYRHFDLERRKTVEAITQVHGNISYLDPNVYTVSGLEQHLSRRQMIARKMQTRQHCHAVLQTQHFQRYFTGIIDPEAIRDVSLLFSKPAAERAHLRGMLDHTLV